MSTPPTCFVLFKKLSSGAYFLEYNNRKLYRNVYLCSLNQGCANTGSQIARATAFSSVATSVCGSWAWELLCDTFLPLIILIWLLDFLIMFVPALGPTHSPTRWDRVSFPGVKRPVRGVDHPPPSSAEVKERVELYLYSPSGPSWPVLG